MELKWFRYFVVSVDAGSLSRAAEALYTTQPNVSKIIKELEDSLGVSLLERGRRGVVMTEEGQQIYKYARQMLECSENISDTLSRRKRQYLSVAFMQDYQLEKTFARILQNDKKLQARLTEGTLEQVVHQVGHRQNSLGFVFVAGGQRQIFNTMVARRKLEFHEICPAIPVLYAGPLNPCYNYNSVTREALGKISFVQYREEGVSLFAYFSTDRGELLPQNLEKRVEVESTSQLFRMLEYTEMGFLGCCLTEKYTPGEAIRKIPLEDCAVDICFGYLKRLDHRLEPCEEECIDFIRRLSQA